MHDPNSAASEATRSDEPQHLSDSKTSQSGPIDPTLLPMTEGLLSPSGSTHDASQSPFATIERRLGHYELLDLLGQGGMGSVYRARNVNLDKLVALKLLPANFMRTEQALTRFKREMKAVGKIDHPNIVRAMDAGDVDGTHYLTMELVDGTDLAKLVKERGPLSVGDTCKAIRQAALGLDAAHREGVIHRDIKPANLLLAKNGQIKILDLGLASMADDSTVHEGITSSGQVLGTPDYMAPEQWEDTHSAEARTDLYALGCTLFYLLAGRAPFATDEFKSVLRKMSAHVNSPIPDLSAMRADVPDGVCAIYLRLMAKRPEERFASAGDLALALAPFATGKPGELKNSTTELQVVPVSPVNAKPVLNGLSESDGESIAIDTAHAPPRVKLPGPPRRLAGKFIGSLIGGMALLLLISVIVIMIANKDGTKTRIEVPGDSPIAVVTMPSNLPNDTRAGWQGWPADSPPPASAPFDTATARQRQQLWADYLKVPVEYTNSIGMEFSKSWSDSVDFGSSPIVRSSGI